jgi:hypothetical protein
VLCEAARLADKLGFALESGGIAASQEATWLGYAKALEGLLGLVGSTMPLAWVINSVDGLAKEIAAPQTGL